MWCTFFNHVDLSESNNYEKENQPVIITEMSESYSVLAGR
jgi:hypothetical protein